MNGVVMSREPLVMTDDLVVYRINNIITSSFSSGQNLMTVLEANKDRFSVLINAIEVAGLKSTLANGKKKALDLPVPKLIDVIQLDGPFTLFAPTNEAFRSLPSEALARLMASPAELRRCLLGHVTKGTFFLAALDSKDSGTDRVLPTLDGGSNKIMISGKSKGKFH